jgi:hypothetical protein
MNSFAPPLAARQYGFQWNVRKIIKARAVPLVR